MPSVFRFGVIWDNWPVLVSGLSITLLVTLASLCAGLVIGIASTVRLFARSGVGVASGGTRTVGDARAAHRWRGAVVAIEFALAVPMLSAGALLLNSLLRLQHVDPGFEPHGLHAVRIALPVASYSDAGAVATFWSRVSARVADAPLEQVFAHLDRAAPHLMKPNAEELASVAGGDPDAIEADPALAAAAAQVLVDRGVTNVLATLGAGGAVLVTADGAWHATPPPTTSRFA